MLLALYKQIMPLSIFYFWLAALYGDIMQAMRQAPFLYPHYIQFSVEMQYPECEIL